MIAFLKFFVIKELLMCLSFFTLVGACLLRTLQKAVSNLLHVESFSFSNSLFKGTIVKIDKALTNDHLSVSKVSQKLFFRTPYNSALI